MPVGSSLTVHNVEDFSKIGMSLEMDALLHNFTDGENQLMKNDKDPWRGAREKCRDFFNIFIQTLTAKHDIVMDWQCGTSLSNYFWIWCSYS